MVKTNVVDVHVSSIRPIYRTLKDWMENPQNVYIGRKGVIFVDNVRFPSLNSIWANPFTLKKFVTIDACLDAYRDYLQKLLSTEHGLAIELRKLDGKNLGCWCVDRPENKGKSRCCHGHVLIDFINIYRSTNP